MSTNQCVRVHEFTALTKGNILSGMNMSKLTKLTRNFLGSGSGGLERWLSC